MHKRLTLLTQGASQGRMPTTAQIAAAYATMATGNHDNDCWGMLLTLAQQAVGVLTECVGCGPTHTVSKLVQGKFIRIPCPACQGYGKRRIHVPAPNELPGNMAPVPQPAQMSPAQQVAALLAKFAA